MGFFFSQKKKSFRAKVISFINQKGGVGKTTMAYNTAFALANQGKNVLCVDMDPQANLGLLFGHEVEEGPHIFHLLLNSLRELKALHSGALAGELIVPINKTLDLLPSGQELSGFELTVAGISSPRQLILRKFFEKNGILDEYDYVVVDGPPTLGLLMVNIICASDGVFVPFRPDDFSKKGLTHFHQALDDVADMDVVRAPKILGYIPNLLDQRRKQEVDDLQSIEKFLGNESNLLAPFHNRSHLVKSLSHRKSVFDYSSKDYKELQDKFNTIANIVVDWPEDSSHV